MQRGILPGRLTAFAFSLFLLLAASPATAQRETLKVGDAAPGLDVEEWVKGEETSIASGRVSILVFFTSTDEASRATIPFFSDLQEVWGETGLTVIGISDEAPEVVRSAVRSAGSAIKYPVAADRRKATSRAWKDAAGRKDAHVAFIVDQKGRIAFIGNPGPRADHDRMVEVLDKVMRGRFDPKLEREAAPLLKTARDARESHTWRVALKAYDEVIDLSPTVFADVAIERFHMMLVDMRDKKGAYEFAQKLRTEYFADDANALVDLAEKIAMDASIPDDDRDLDLSLEAANAAFKISSHSHFAMETLALVHYRRGELNDAVKMQRRAWMTARPRYKPELKRDLESYQRAVRRADR